MRTLGGSTENGRRLFVALMGYQRTIATPATPPIAPFFTRSFILRPTPPSYAPPRPTTATMSSLNDSSSVDAAPLDSLFKQKRILRSRVRKDLKSMDPILRSQQDDAIQNVVLEAPWFKSCKRLCAYISCSALREVDTTKILSYILQNPAKGKKLYVPRVEDKNRSMRMLNISSTEDLIANSMKILEPAPFDADGNEREDLMFANEPVDLFLLPGLAFDRSGRRLGRGGGYYDTLLLKYQELAKERKWKQPLLIALSYSLQILEDGVIPVTPSDVFIDALVSPSGLIPISPALSESCHS